MDEFRQLTDEAARIIGLDGLEPDGDGVVEFVSDEATVAVQFVPEAGDMVLWSAKVLEAPPPDGQDGAAALRLALESNFNSSATLSIDPEDGALVLTDYAPLRSLSPETFVARLESFVNALVACRRKIESAASPRVRNDEIRNTNDELAEADSSSANSSFVARHSSFEDGFMAV